MKRRTKIILAVALLMLIGGGWWVFSGDGKPSWRRYLPRTATDIHEWAWADGFLPDYSYLLKARITDGEFQTFVTQLGLTPHTADRNYSDDSHWLSWQRAPGFNENWWDASPALDSTYVWQGKDTWAFAKYENGFLYFQSLNH